jgi:hypothetical protein
MPTKEQINQTEEYIRKNHIRKGNHDWINLKPELQEILFCPTCNERIQRVFGGHYVYFYGNRREKSAKIRDTIKYMIKEGKEIKEIAKELGLSIYSILYHVKKMKRNKENETIKK